MAARASFGRRELLAGIGASVGALGLLGCDHAGACEAEHPTSTEASTDPAADFAADFAALGGMCADAAPITAPEYEARIERIRAKLAEADQAALIVEAGVDMRYLGGPAWGLSERPLLLLIPRAGDPTLVGPSFERGTLDARAGPLAFAVRSWDEHEDPYALAQRVLIEAGLRAGEAVAVAPATRSFVVEGLRAAAPTRGFDAGSTALEQTRRVKTDTELALLRRVNEATKAALALAAGQARVGMHEREFAEIVREAQLAAGLDSVWVLALFGPNAAFPHGTPEGRELAEGDLILVDTGGFLHGYASDITRTWAFPEPGSIDAERRRAWSVVRDAQAAALAKIRPGVRCAEVDAAAREVVAAAGFDGDYGHFSHRLGHGIGMQVHEAPYLVRDAEHRLEPGNTMSNEPGLYLPGEYGIRLEDIVAVTEAGAEVFGPLAASLDAPFG